MSKIDKEITRAERINAALWLAGIAKKRIICNDGDMGYQYSLLASLVLSDLVSDKKKKTISTDGNSVDKLVRRLNKDPDLLQKEIQWMDV